MAGAGADEVAAERSLPLRDVLVVLSLLPPLLSRLIRPASPPVVSLSCAERLDAVGAACSMLWLSSVAAVAEPATAMHKAQPRI